MIDPALVMFAIEAGIKLGRKVNEVLVDETAQRPLLLPLGDLFGSVTEAAAMDFFNNEGSYLIETKGSFHPYRANRPKLTELYRAMLGVEAAQGPAANATARRGAVVVQLAALEQFDQNFKAKHPARRIFGTLVEIGIDYLATHPEALGKDSPARKVIQSFVSALDETDFAEGPGREVLGDLLSAALQTVGSGVGLVSDDQRLQVLLGGVLDAVAGDLHAAIQSGNELSRQQLFRRIGSSILRGGGTAFSENINLFLPGEGTAQKLVGQTLTQVLAGLDGKEDLFTSESIEVIFKSALRVAAENGALVTDDKVLQELIARVLTVVGDQQWNRLFSSATAASVLVEALEVFRENMETLIDPKNPKEQLLANALAAMAGSLSAKLAGGGSVQDLLSRSQLLDLTRVIFGEVAKHPDLLVGGSAADPKNTVLAQVIGSVARALGDDPLGMTNGAGFVELVQIALAVAVQNADKLVDTKSTSPTTNLLFSLLKQIVTAVTEAKDPRQLLSRAVFVDIVRRVLTTASANLQVLVGPQPKAVQATVAAALELASGALANQVNGANLPLLIQQLLHQVLWEELDLAEKKALEQAALRILKAA